MRSGFGLRAGAAVAAALGYFLTMGLPASASPSKQPGRATFALIIGVTDSVDPDQDRLRYADDDAAGYQTLFRALGARTYLLARFDDSTRRLHPQAAAEAQHPLIGNVERVVDVIADDVRVARERGLQTTFYVTYAGHGRIRENKGYLALEDGRLDSEAIRRIVDHVASTTTHIIVDACHADFLAYGRGPGGERRPVSGFATLADALAEENVGLFLSSSATGEAHEWEGFQAGVFSHEVRSGLYGAADANGDGVVSYKELAAFVARANAGVVNDRYRPSVIMRAPKASEVLVDLHQAVKSRVRFAGTEPSAHYYLEDESGVRVLDLHNSYGQGLSIVRPAGQGRLYLKRLDDRSEIEIVPSASDVVVATLVPSPSSDAPRGAAHIAFSSLFSLPFDQATVDQLDLSSDTVVAKRTVSQPEHSGISARTVGGVIAGGIALAAVAAGTVSYLSARSLKASLGPNSSDKDVERTNRSIDTRNNMTVTSCAVAGGAVAAALWLLWPNLAGHAAIDVGPDHQSVAFSGRF
jgi:hypothetical protein